MENIETYSGSIIKCMRNQIDIAKYNELLEYFEGVLTLNRNVTADIRNVFCINGRFFVDGSQYYCDYCNLIVHLNEGQFCYDCYKDMCGDCFHSRYVYENNPDRYAMVDICRQHRLRPSLDRMNVICDVCDLPISILSDYYTNNREYHVCVDCYDTVSSRSLTKIVGEMLYGSMFDWIVIGSDSYGNCITCNLNPRSRFYTNFGAIVVDHDERGYFSTNEKNKETIKNLIDGDLLNLIEHFKFSKLGDE